MPPKKRTSRSSTKKGTPTSTPTMSSRISPPSPDMETVVHQSPKKPRNKHTHQSPEAISSPNLQELISDRITPDILEPLTSSRSKRSTSSRTSSSLKTTPTKSATQKKSRTIPISNQQNDDENEVVDLTQDDDGDHDSSEQDQPPPKKRSASGKKSSNVKTASSTAMDDGDESTSGSSDQASGEPSSSSINYRDHDDHNALSPSTPETTTQEPVSQDSGDTGNTSDSPSSSNGEEDSQEMIDVNQYLIDQGCEVNQLNISQNTFRKIFNFFESNNGVHHISTLQRESSLSNLKQALIQEALSKMTKEGYLVEVGTGVYHLNQSYLTHIPDAVNIKLERKLTHLQTIFNNLTNDLLHYDQQTKLLDSQLRTEDLKHKIIRLREEVKLKQARINKFKTLPVDPKYRETLKEQFVKVLNEWRKRKQAAYAMMEPYLSTVKKTQKQFIAEIGVDTDEDVKVQPKTYIDFKQQFVDKPAPNEEQEGAKATPGAPTAAPSPHAVPSRGMLKCTHSLILTLTVTLIFGFLCSISADYAIPDAQIMRIEPITDVKIIASERNNIDILTTERAGIKFIRAKGDTLSSSAPFGNSIQVKCKLFEQDFVLKLYLDTKVISSETSLFIDGEYVEEQPNFFTYTSTFVYDDGSIGYASFTIIPVGDRLSIDGLIVKDGETYHVEHVRVHEFLLEKTRHNKSQALAAEEFIIASYVSNGEPIDPVNQQNVQRLSRDLSILDKEQERLKNAVNAASHQLIGFRLTDLQGIHQDEAAHELCQELHPDFEEYKASLDGDSETVLQMTGTSGKKKKTLEHAHHSHHHDHHHHEKHASGHRSSILSLTSSRQHHHMHYIPFSRHEDAHRPAQTPVDSGDIYDASERDITTAPSFTYGPATNVELLQLIGDGNDLDSGSYHHDLQSTPLQRSPLLSRWSECHPYASKGTTLVKVNLLVTYGASVFLTGSRSPTHEDVVAALTTLVSKANGPLFIQLGMKIALANVYIMTTPDRTKVPWNFGEQGDPDGGCPESAFEVIYVVKDTRTDKKNPLPPAAITHLLTSCYDQGVVGQAYVGGMRHHEFSTGWASLRDSASWTTFLHEILHSIGASHPFNKDATTAGTYGGIMDYGKGEVEGALISGPFAGQIGLNVDSDYETLCTSLQTRGFKEDDDTLFSLAESFTFITGGWLCRRGDGSPADTGDDPLRSCQDATTWGDCSGKCGVGRTKRLVVCTDDDGKQVKDSECDETKPPTERECNDTSQCNHVVYGWKCGKRLSDLRKPSQSINCYSDSDEEQQQTWSACSSSCGEGVQKRVRKCGTSADTWVDDQLCIDNLEELAPALERTCYADASCSFTWMCGDPAITVKSATSKNTGQCTNDAFFSTECSNQCGSGELKRSVFCLRSGVFLPPAECSSIASSRPAASKPCSSTSNCTYTWMCRDSSRQQRFVSCLSKPADSADGDSESDHQGKDSSNWSPCSAQKCGVKGSQTRDVVCLRQDDATVMSDATKCDAKTKPITERPCSTPCDGDSDEGSDIDSDTGGDDVPTPTSDRYIWRCSPYATLNGYNDTFDCIDTNDPTDKDDNSADKQYTECVTPLCRSADKKKTDDTDNTDKDDAAENKPKVKGTQYRFPYCFDTQPQGSGAGTATPTPTQVEETHCISTQGTPKPSTERECSDECSTTSLEQSRVRYQWAVMESILCCYNNTQMVNALNDIISTASASDDQDGGDSGDGKNTDDNSPQEVTLQTDTEVIRQQILDNIAWFSDENINHFGIRQEQTLKCLDTMTRKLAKDQLCKQQKDDDSPTGKLIKPPTTRPCTKQLIQQCSASSDKSTYYDEVFRHPETNIIPGGPNTARISYLHGYLLYCVFAICTWLALVSFNLMTAMQ